MDLGATIAVGAVSGLVSGAAAAWLLVRRRPRPDRPTSVDPVVQSESQRLGIAEAVVRAVIELGRIDPATFAVQNRQLAEWKRDRGSIEETPA